MNKMLSVSSSSGRATRNAWSVRSLMMILAVLNGLVAGLVLILLAGGFLSSCLEDLFLLQMLVFVWFLKLRCPHPSSEPSSAAGGKPSSAFALRVVQE